MTPYQGGTDLASPHKRSANGDRDREAKKVRKDRRESGGEEVVIVVGVRRRSARKRNERRKNGQLGGRRGGMRELTSAILARGVILFISRP